MESLYELSEIGMNIRSKADWWLGELKLSRDRAEAKLRELADAAEWRDELRFIRSLIDFYKVVECLRGGREYEHFVRHLLTNEDAKFEFDNIMSASEADYQAALAAAKVE